MLNFKVRDISSSILYPESFGPILPSNSVIFYANNDFSSYSNKDNWSFIDMSQIYDNFLPSVIVSSGVNPSEISYRGVPGTKSTKNTKQFLDDTSYTTDNFQIFASGYHGYTETAGVSVQPFLNTGTIQRAYNSTSGFSYHGHTLNNSITVSVYDDNNNKMYEFGSDKRFFHFNTPSSSNSLYYPTSFVVGGYRLINQTSEIPKNTIVFAQSAPEDYTLMDSSIENCYLLSGNSIFVSENVGKKYGSSYFIVTTTTTSGGDHDHGAYPITYDGTTHTTGSRGTFDNLYNDSRLPVTSGGHVHSVTLKCTKKMLSKKLKLYKANKNTGCFSGMIIGYLNSNINNLPNNWYLCNGQTITTLSGKTYVTPNLLNNAIKCSNLYYDAVGDSSDSISIDATFSNPNKHSHIYNQNGIRIDFYETTIPQGRMHRSQNWNHDHPYRNSHAPSTVAYYSLFFIIYLP